jgi:hypothetical protein
LCYESLKNVNTLSIDGFRIELFRITYKLSKFTNHTTLDLVFTNYIDLLIIFALLDRYDLDFDLIYEIDWFMKVPLKTKRSFFLQYLEMKN